MKPARPRAALVLAALLACATCRSSRPAAPDAAADMPGPAGDAPAGETAGTDTAPAADTPPARPDRQQVLRDLVQLVIVPSYAELRARADSLALALSALEQTTDAPTLMAARATWRETRTSWRHTVAFGIGPADDLAVTGGIVDEPTNGPRLETLLAATTPLDATALRSLPAQVRGLLAVEYLLFDPALTDAELLLRFAGDAGKRRLGYLSLIGAELAMKLGAVAEGWSARFGAEVVEAGRGSTTFARERDAYDALLNKSLAVIDRTIDSLRTAAGGPAPSTTPPLTLRSDNVLADLDADLLGFEDLYLARRGSSVGLAVADVVRDMNAPADTQMRQTLTSARAALALVPRPVSTAGVASAAVVQAITALRAVKAALATGIFGALGASVGFSDNDGD